MRKQGEKERDLEDRDRLERGIEKKHRLRLRM
jgi:hypothetical protein